MDTVWARSVPEAFLECIWRIKICGAAEDSRNGPVRVMPGPFMLTIQNPWERLLFDDARQANPYFHMAEFIWMMAGSNKLKWLARYNKKMWDYSDDGLTQPGAYGYRWRNHFDIDQIRAVVRLLREEPNTRRAVLGMWDPMTDCEKRSADLPCNTHIYFRNVSGKLTMTVCNRSNDLIWGMLGANAVHMTMLHELVARATGLLIGEYHVFTNNLHIYEAVPRYKELMMVTTAVDPYRTGIQWSPLLSRGDTLDEFLADAERAITGIHSGFTTHWFREVARPMLAAYEIRIAGGDETPMLEVVSAEDWRLAGLKWKEWKSV